MAPLDNTTSVPFHENDDDKTQILDGIQRKKYFSDIASSQKSKKLFRHTLPEILKKLKK